MTKDDKAPSTVEALGPTGERVMRNVAKLRRSCGLNYRELSERLSGIGRPIPELGLSRIEKGKRRVDADDLVALAIVFGVSPKRLLMPDEADATDVALTERVTTGASEAWAWIDGRWPLMTEDQGDMKWEPEGRELVEEFTRKSRPPGLRRRQEHPAVKAAEWLIHSIDLLLRTDDVRQEAVTEEDLERLMVSRITAATAPQEVRESLARLDAEIAKLLDASTPADPRLIDAWEALDRRYTEESPPSTGNASFPPLAWGKAT